MELEPTEEKIRANEQQDRSPFVVRAHHLDNFRNLLKSGISVSDFVNIHCGLLEKYRASLDISKNWQSYINDILGSTQEQADKFRRYEIEFFEEFLQLPPDYTVKIAEDQKDKICLGCAIGEHCSEKVLAQDSADKIYIKFFRKVAKKLNVEGDLKVVDEIVTYNNAKPRNVKFILTTAGTVKKIILSRPASY